MPDVSVLGTEKADWQAMLDLIGPEGWAYECPSSAELPTAEQILDASADTDVDLKVWPVPEMLAIFRFSAAEEIDFDVDLLELQDQERLDVLCTFFRTIGRTLRKPVVMAFEELGSAPMIGYDVRWDRVVRLASHIG